MERSELDDLVKFFRMSGRLKGIVRSGWVEVGVDSPESVAGHTFRTALLCMVFSDLEGLDGLKMLRMALLHDLPEVITGDLTPLEKTNAAEKSERSAMKRLLSLLPTTLREKYTMLWREYMECKTEEAKAVKELEKLEMALQAREYEEVHPSLRGWERFMKSADGAIISQEVRKLLSHILESDS